MIGSLFAIIAGITLTLQNSMNGLMTPTIGAMGASFVCFLTQTILLLVYRLVKEKKTFSLKGISPIYCTSGLLAAVTVATTGICVTRMGTAVTSCCSVAGQIILSAFIDHFGLFSTPRHRFTGKRIPGFALVLIGILSINLVGSNSSSSIPLWLLAIAVCLGATAVIVRTFNHKMSSISGNLFDGAIINSLGGAVSGLVLFIILNSFRPDFSLFGQVPPIYYLAGIFGVICLICNILAYKKQNIFYCTLFLLIGQVGTGIVMDILVFHTLSFAKCIGIVLVLVGALLDKTLSRS